MSKLTHCNFTTEHSLGKGEVDSSILSGSTTKACKIEAFRAPRLFRPAVNNGTERETRNSIRVKSGEKSHFVPRNAVT
jgi:hypothetical protein